MASHMRISFFGEIRPGVDPGHGNQSINQSLFPPNGDNRHI